MDSMPSERQSSLLGVATFVSALLVVYSYLDYALNIWPLKLGEARWRFGAVGVLTNYLGLIMLGTVLWLWFQYLAGNRVHVRVVAVLAGLQTLLLLGLLVGFPLDFLQIRGDVQPDDQWNFKAAAARTGVKLFLSTVAFIWITRAGFKNSKAEGGRGRRESTPLIVGVDRGG